MNDRLARGDAGLLVFHDARRFVPRSVAARGVSVDASDAPTIVALLGLVVTTRERNAAFYARP